MIWTRSDGRRLEAREVGPVKIALRAPDGAPLPIVDAIEPEAQARNRLRELLDTGLYTKESP
jgi:hypothetical protein